MTSGAATARGGRPRLFLLLAAGVAVASTAAILVAAPRPADHQVLADLSVPAILGAGFIDGFNPCAFGVLILFATFALGLAARESLAGEGGGPGVGAARVGAASRHVLGLGAFFVAGVLVTYFLLGLGLLTVLASLTDFGGNHLPSRITALIAVGLGLWMIRDLLLPDARWKLEAPHSLHGRMRDWARVTSPVALFGGGVLIGLCTVPCSGAVYLGVVALLSTSGTVTAGLGGLALYNLAYITPLVALLVLASRPRLIRVLNRWHLEHAMGTKVVLAIVVLALGFAILLTV
jgi:cytochrome c biogenesis protein CcdA